MGIWDILKFGSKKAEAIEEIVPEEPAELRSDDRETMYRDSRVYYASGGSDPCIINDVSDTGLRISCQVAKSFPEQVRIRFGGQKRLCNVVWNNGIVVGLEFADMATDNSHSERKEDAPLFSEDPLT